MSDVLTMNGGKKAHINRTDDEAARPGTIAASQPRNDAQMMVG
jgi:hypothetical protein